MWNIQESFEERQKATAEALGELFREMEANEKRKKEQAAKGLDSLTYYIYSTLTDSGIANPDVVSQKIKESLIKHPNWQLF